MASKSTWLYFIHWPEHLKLVNVDDLMSCVFYGNKKHFCDQQVSHLELVMGEGSLFQSILDCLWGNEINGEVTYVELLKAQSEVWRVCALSAIPAEILEDVLFEAAWAKKCGARREIKVGSFLLKILFLNLLVSVLCGGNMRKYYIGTGGGGGNSVQRSPLNAFNWDIPVPAIILFHRVQEWSPRSGVGS